MTVPIDDVGAFVGPPAVLATGRDGGPLTGATLAVKDVFDVAGTVTRAGNPDFARDRPPAATHADAVAALVEAGATVVGRTITDELAYSLSGTNVHDGTPRNVRAPGRIPGGSSAGSAAAVAAGLVDFGLGTDTGGSVRVPASFCGIHGWRPTHGAVSAQGVVPLAPSFDTVGLLARDLGLLERAARVLLGIRPDGGTDGRADAGAREAGNREVVLAEELLAVVPPDVADAVVVGAERLCGRAVPVVTIGVDPEQAAATFRTLQGREAWAVHGPWIRAEHPRFGPGIAARFTAASQVSAEAAHEAVPVREAIRAAVVAATAGGRVVLAPAAPGPALRVDAPHADRELARARALALTSPAGLAGAPVVSLAMAEVDDLPLGVAAMGSPGSDADLLRWAVGAVGRATGPSHGGQQR